MIPWHLTFPVINFSWHLSDSNISSVALQGWVLFMESEHSPSKGRYLFSFYPPLSSAEKSRQGKPERRGAKLQQRPKNTDAGFRVTGVFRRSQKLAQERGTLSSFLCGASLLIKISCGFLPYPTEHRSPCQGARPMDTECFFISKSLLSSANSQGRGY